MLYMIWDLETRNLVAEYASKQAALELVLSGIAQSGPGDTDTLALEVEDDEGNITAVAHGRELAELVQRELGAVTRAD